MYYVYKNKKIKSWTKLRKEVKKRPSTSPVYCMKGICKRVIHTEPKTSDLNFNE